MNKIECANGCGLKNNVQCFIDTMIDSECPCIECIVKTMCTEFCDIRKEYSKLYVDKRSFLLRIKLDD